MMRVFISSPYSVGDVQANVQVQIDVLDQLLDLGYSPFVPLLFHYAKPRAYEDWIKLDLDYLDVCDVILRLPGESAGADNEVAHAQAHNIPVVYSIEQLIELYPVSRA